MAVHLLVNVLCLCFGYKSETNDMSAGETVQSLGFSFQGTWGLPRGKTEARLLEGTAQSLLSLSYTTNSVAPLSRGCEDSKGLKRVSDVTRHSPSLACYSFLPYFPRNWKWRREGQWMYKKRFSILAALEPLGGASCCCCSCCCSTPKSNQSEPLGVQPEDHQLTSLTA